MLKKLFKMKGGFVLNFYTKERVADFFANDVGINIYDSKYDYKSGSQAKRVERLWKVGSDAQVGKSIIKLVYYIRNQCLIGELDKEAYPKNLMEIALQTGHRLLGKESRDVNLTEEEFLGQDFSRISIESLGLAYPIVGSINQRLGEIQKCMKAGAPLAVIFLCGSALEGVLLGVAENNQKKFNTAQASPKRNGKVNQLHEWTLRDLINVACETEMINIDVKKFSHSLRDFRNYIHPYRQVVEKFNPNMHTAEICQQVLLAALTQLSGK